MPNDSVKFRSQILNYTVEEEPIFSNISKYALTVLSLPCSNAYVERVFSIVTFMKDQYSNRMHLSMLDSIIMIKTHLQAKTCFIN